MPTSPYEAVRTNPFDSFVGDSINVRDRKHMSIIDAPVELSPGGNTARKHTTPYRLSDLASSNSSRENIVEKDGELEEPDAGLNTGPDGGERGVEDAAGDEVAAFGKDRVVAGDEDNVEDVKTPLKTRRTSKSASSLRNCRAEYLSDIGSGSEGGDDSDADSVAHSYDAKSVAGSDQHSADGNRSENEAASNQGTPVEEDVDKGSEASNQSDRSRTSKASSVADEQSVPQESSNSISSTLHQKKIAEGFSWLWETRTHSDLTIRCNNQELCVHKCILAAQCRHFNPIIQGSNETSLNLDDDDPEALKSMLQYLYIGSLAVPDPNLTTPGGPGLLVTLDTLLKTFELGCKYSLPNLKAEAVKQYIALLSTKWENGHAVFLAKVLMKIFKIADAAKGGEEWFVSGAVEVREKTLEVAVSCAEELVSDAVALSLLDGQALRALVVRVVQGRHAAAGDHVASPTASSPATPSVPKSGCSAEDLWK
jgi:hypothetical protein